MDSQLRMGGVKVPNSDEFDVLGGALSCPNPDCETHLGFHSIDGSKCSCGFQAFPSYRVKKKLV